MEQKVIGDPYFLQTKQEIEDWLKEYDIENYIINDDLTVDVDGNVYFDENNSYKLLNSISVKFKKVEGDFSCKETSLTSLKGCPDVIKGYFSCSFNKITSLEYCPKEIGGSFYCGSNKLTSLKGCPEKINGFFDCGKNELTSLEYHPIADGDIFIGNPLKTLKGLINISADLLIILLVYYVELDWKEIEWNEVKNIDEITVELYENIEKKENVKNSEEALRKIQELQLF